MRSFHSIASIAIAIMILVAPQAAPADSRLSIQDVRNATYRVVGIDETVTLKNGAYSRPAAPGSASRIAVQVDRVPVVFADVTGDRRADAVLILVSSGGGTGTFREVAVVSRRGGKVVHVASADLGDRTPVLALRVRGGVIRVRVRAHGPKDPACCPSVERELRYRLVGNRLRER